MTTYQIHSMFGPTVKEYDTLHRALEELWRLKNSNGGLYRVLDSKGKEYARMDTYATYWPLNYEANKEMRERTQRARQQQAK